MRCPNERLAIHNRIMAVTKKRQTFERDDLIDIYPGAHFWEDWQEVLDSLVAKGKLTIDSYLDQISGCMREVYELVR